MKLCIKIFMIALIFTGCDKDKPTCQGIDCLPPATQTGAGTFGCLVNGVPYVDNSGRFNCFYQLLNGKYYFNISPTFKNYNLLELDLGSNNINFEIKNQFILSDYSEGNGAAAFFVADGNRNIQTSVNNSNICRITLFDTQKYIISGTFEFKIFDEVTQTLYVITEGRFDAKFTQ